MFTGIIEEIGVVSKIIKGTSSVVLTIGCERILEDVKKGDSISVNGICLTVTDFSKNLFYADVMPETMKKTGLSALKPSDMVNLERALRLSDRLGGHIVSGHIDGTGVIAGIKDDDNATWLTIDAPDNILRYIVMKGSVALDGTSLTVAYVDKKCFKVSLIPLTKGLTILGSRKAGDTVNIECDVLGKYIEKLFSVKDEYTKMEGSLSMEILKQNGFA